MDDAKCHKRLDRSGRRGALGFAARKRQRAQSIQLATTTYTLTATDGTDTVDESVTVTVTDALAQPSITRFEPDDDTLTPTQTTTVRWSGVNGVSGTITGPSLNRALTTSELTAGTESIGPLSAGNHTYRLRLNGEAGTTQATRTFTVTVSATPPPDPPVTIDSFTRDDSTIESGESTTLRWTTSNADAVTLDGSTVSADGSMSVSPTSTTTYTLRATGTGGPVTRTVTVTVTEAPSDPEVVSFTASATTIQQGGSVTISWVTRNGDTRLLASTPPLTHYSNQAASGSRTFTPSVTQTYQIQVWNAVDPTGTLDAESITVTVTAVPAAVVDSFSTSDSSPDVNENFTLSWTTTGATRVRLQLDQGLGFGFSDVGGDRAADGSYTTSMSGIITVDYRIRAYNSADEITTSSEITITVS